MRALLYEISIGHHPFPVYGNVLKSYNVFNSTEGMESDAKRQFQRIEAMKAAKELQSTSETPKD